MASVAIRPKSGPLCCDWAQWRAYPGDVKHTRMDSLLLAGVGTLAVHEIAYVPGSIGTSIAGGDGVSHAHIPLLWGVGGSIAILALIQYVVRSLRSRSGERFVDPRWLGLTMGALYISQEAAERALSGSPAISLLTEWVLWAGLLAVPLVAWVLARLVRCIVDFAGKVETRRRAPTSAPPVARPVVPTLRPALARLDHVLSRRGPPLVVSH